VGAYEPLSFAHKLAMRAQIKGISIRFGMAAWWLTVNPSDLRNPLVLQLAGIIFPVDSMPAAAAAIRKMITVTSNPVAVAEFFHYLCNSLFLELLRSGTDTCGILGKVAAHYGVVETNGRGMFHIHSLIWLSGNFTLDELRRRVLEDNEFATRLTGFLESVITNAIDRALSEDTESQLSEHIPQFPDDICDDDFYEQLLDDSQGVAAKCQMHSPKHNATCFKYGNKSKCRFGMPRELIPESYVDDFGVVHLQRSNGWITSYNAAIASCIRSNHDLSWIPTSSKALALVYYLTNYATKADLSPHQMLVKAALVAESMSSLEGNDSADDIESRQDAKYLLRLYNVLAHEQEISGEQIASVLSQFPSRYTNCEKFSHVGIYRLRRHIRVLLQILPVDELAEDPCVLPVRSQKPVDRFDNYRWRGEILKNYSFFEYCMLVQRSPRREASTSDCLYDETHPNFETHVQRPAKTSAQIHTVCLHGQLSEFQEEEESVKRGHTITAAIRNDLAEVLLAFFVPWEKLLPLFEEYCPQNKTRNEAYSEAWCVIEPTLPEHLRNYARNFGLLQKSKEEVAIDKSLRTTEDELVESAATIEAETDNDEVDNETTFENIWDSIRSETLIMTCHNIVMSWHRAGLSIAPRFPALKLEWSPCHDLQNRNLSPLDIFRPSSRGSSGLQLVADNILQEWQLRLKAPPSNSDEDFSYAGDGFADDGFSDMELSPAGLQPTLE